MRDLDHHGQFYTMSGRWCHRTAKGARFYVPGFVESHELDEIRPFLPQSDIPKDMENKMQVFSESVPRNIGKALLKKMTDFWAQSEAVYQAAAARLDNAHSSFADPQRYTYATLDEIADRVLPRSIPKGEDGKFSQPALYAVHRSLLRDDIGFRAQARGTLRAGGQYEINSVNEVQIARRVTEYVRKYREDMMMRSKKTWKSPLHSFITKARNLVDLSRKDRQYTTHGTIGPSLTKSQDGDHYRYGTVKETFTSMDEEIIRFLESWACLSSFGVQSALNGIGSTILRAIDRYEETPLDQTAAWTFLQEIGAMPPWQTPAAFNARLPATGRRLYLEPQEVSGGYTPDKLANIRRDWVDTTVYCIDDPGAHEIDDGVSLEATDSPDEYWVHVHVADPAAHIDPQGPTGKFAEQLTETVYMPDRIVPMISKSFTQGNLSLASGRPCLTFSARINLAGDMLEHKITAGRIQDVVFLSPAVLKEVIMGPSPGKKVVRTVGSNIPPVIPSRPMLEIHQLSDEYKEDLKMLHEIGLARGQQYRARGGISAGPVTPSLAISFDGAEWRRAKNGKSIQHHGDPTIRLVTEDLNWRTLSNANNGIDIVGYFMLIANEVAAQWCNDRGLPIPYRVTPLNVDKENPAQFYQRVVLPSTDATGKVPTDVAREYLSLIGQVQPSTTPGPHVAVGAEMIAKCTSPLRRYGDLLVHWQVEAALLQEARSGKSLVGNTRDDFLPFTKAQVDSLLPYLDTRERLIKGANHQAERELMCLFLVRAWRFKQTEMPSTLEFIVRSINPDTNAVGGVIPQFLAGAQFLVPPWTTSEEVKPGDVFEVEFRDINVYQRQINVNVLRRIETSEHASQSATDSV